ncbi:MAG: nucleotidyltransferase domain-containing protein [Candidatus Brennerbacteria bacterium]|nr:nucleotidyltransferase domain-containing protein [Candidatus Brennerbacteria bacterium]
MKKITRATYALTLTEALRLLRKETSVLRNLEFIALLGSVKIKEHVPGYSDLDLLLILKSDASGALDEKLLLELQKICADLSKTYRINISFLTHTEKELVEYVDYEYLKHYSSGKLLYGKPELFSKLFKRIISRKKSYGKKLVREMFKSIVHARFNLIRKFVSLNKFNTRNYRDGLLKLFIDNLFEIADWRLIADEIWCVSKKEIVSRIFSISKSPHREILESAYKYRRDWNHLVVSSKQARSFFISGIKFINDCVRDLERRT